MKDLTVFLIGLSIIVLFSFLMSYPVMLLWNNCLVGAVDGVHQIGWLQAWGITALCGLVIKNSPTSK